MTMCSECTTMCRKPIHLLCLLYSVFIFRVCSADAYFADWGVLGARPQEPTCVKIPEDMQLCTGLDYTEMRLPNLLDHGSVQEAQQQSGSWVPLLNVRCHSDTKLFLCSLFTPVCLETAIYPCRSLCTSVRDACEARMLNYGYHWPDMLNCDNFPVDNDMCIKAMHTGTVPTAGGRLGESVDTCEVCSPVDTFENTLDNFCRADFVIRVKFRRQRKTDLYGKKPRVYKRSKNLPSKLLRRPKISLTGEAGCCSVKAVSKPFFIMGIKQGNTLVPTYILPWGKFKKLKYSIKKFQELNCSDPDLFTSAVMNSKTGKKSKSKTANKSMTKKGKFNKDISKTISNKGSGFIDTTTMTPNTTIQDITFKPPEMEETKISGTKISKRRKKQKNPKKRRRNKKKEEKP